MATVYHPAVKHYTRHAGDTSGIGFYVPTEINLTGLTVRCQVRESSGKLAIQKLSTILGQVTVNTGTGHVWVAFTNVDTKRRSGVYNYEIEAFTPVTFETVQTLLTGTLTYSEEFSHE